MAEAERAKVSDETFDEFLADESLLPECEENAIEEIIADQICAQLGEAAHSAG